MQQDLAPFKVDDNLLRELWVLKLPKAVCMVLASCVGCPLSVAAEVADNTMAFYSQGTTFTCSALADKADQPSVLATQLAAISARLGRIKQASSQPCQQFHRRRSRSRGISRRSPSASLRRPLCWYHHKWNAQARQCIAPCQWSGTGKQGKGKGNE
ncbi:unnamed protein product [Echinostoma caproni]|uniref:Mercuric transport protein periplasmic component n=1 Tax=Echinostoma caproni TaxID=27848 RepID=A0A183A4V9_9TREM|nr:unnamed protein product [Echinostoma caproni]